MSTSLQTAFGITAFAGVFCALTVRSGSDPAAQTAVLLAAVLATGNALCSLLLSRIGARQTSTKGFFGAVLGGMLLRMSTTLAAFAVGLKILLLPAIPFAVALLALSGVFTVVEVSVWSRQDFSPRVQLS